ncbi:MAG: ATPase, T2SS/T4P/T4SS family [Clostridia bacterium]
MKTNVRIGDVLLGLGYITETDLNTALKEQRSNSTKRIGEILIDLKIITEGQLLTALSNRLDIDVVNLTTTEVDIDVVAVVPKQLSIKYNIIAISQNERFVQLIVNDPLDFYAIEDVKSFFSKQCELLLADKSSIISAITRSYSEIEARSAASAVAKKNVEIEEILNDFEVSSDLAPIVNLVNSIITKGYLEGASDIHFEPFEKQMKVRLRIDGQLLPYMELENGLNLSVATRIKILSSLDIAERRIPQDGSFKMTLNGKSIGVRVSTIPTTFGEKIVLRFLSRDVNLDNAETYGMSQENYDKIRRILMNPHGMIYITGPTGSGKTTTLYMMLETLAQAPVNVSTIEDPVERSLPGITQVQVNQRAGLTFESGLRSMLRQDPDVILVGETRDAETAQISVSAAITGHLVLSTLHTNDAIGTVVRLQNMGVPSYLVANSLIGVVAQRLIKKVCPFCREEYTPNEVEKALIPEAKTLVRGRGCAACSQSGYKGRIAVHEILELDKTISAMVANNLPTEDIYKYIEDTGAMKTIQTSVKELVLQNVTSIEEYIKQTSLIN